MHSKIIIPEKHGKMVYDNKGSATNNAYYLQHESGKGQAIFFNSQQTDIDAETVIDRIDNNLKGLRKDEVKYHNLVISPSQSELKHIKNDPQKLRQFSIQVMDNYAKNFQFRNGQKLTEKDLVWFAAIHNDRYYDQRDINGMQNKGIKELPEVGAKKPGLQSHVHIIVSRRDASQQYTLNPQGQKKKFNLKEWQVRNGESFQMMFGYEKQTISARHHQPKSWSDQDIVRHNSRISQKVDDINLFLPAKEQLDKQHMFTLAAKRNYDKTFFMNLNKIHRGVKNGEMFPEPYRFIDTNKKRSKSLIQAKEISYQFTSILRSFGKIFRGYEGYTEYIGIKKGPSQIKEKAPGKEMDL